VVPAAKLSWFPYNKTLDKVVYYSQYIARYTAGERADREKKQGTGKQKSKNNLRQRGATMTGDSTILIVEDNDDLRGVLVNKQRSVPQHLT